MFLLPIRSIMTDHNNNNTNDDEDHDFEIIHKDEVPMMPPSTTTTDAQDADNQNHPGLWMGIDLGTSNCAAAIWDATRGRPKWIRLQDLAVPQSRKAGRIVPSAVQLAWSKAAKADEKDKTSNKPYAKYQVDNSQAKNGNDLVTLWPVPDESLLWKDILGWNQDNSDLLQLVKTLEQQQPQPSQTLQARVGYKALLELPTGMISGSRKESDTTPEPSQPVAVLTSMKRVLGVCDVTPLEDLDPVFRHSLPFELEERDGTWVVPCSIANSSQAAMQLYVRPIHVAALLLQTIRHSSEEYLRRAIPQKKMQVPGGSHNTNRSSSISMNNVVVGVPAYFGQRQRKAVEEAARLAGFRGHVSTLTESTAAAMAYGLFVAPPTAKTSILVLDMGGGTTDITIASSDNDRSPQPNDRQEETSQFKVMLTDGDNRLGGEDMDQALYQRVLQLACLENELSVPQRQSLLRSCQQAKELLCGDADHGDPPQSSAVVQLPDDLTTPSIKNRTIELTQSDLHAAIQPLLERVAQLLERTLKRYDEKASTILAENNEGGSSGSATIQEVILIGGATRVPALRTMLKDRFFPDIELCVSVNAMSAVAQGTAIQAAILSRQVPLHEVRSAMMLDTTPHAIGVLVPGGNASDGSSRFVEILPRDTPLPAQGYATFYVGDLTQKGITLAAVESIGDPLSEGGGVLHQPLGDFTFLLYRISEAQKDSIRQDKDHPGLRPVDIGMTLDTNGAFQLSIFDSNDPDHIRKRRFYQKAQAKPGEGNLVLDYVLQAATTDWKEEGMTAEEFKLVVTACLLFVFYILVKVLISKADILSEEDMARII